MFAESKRRDPSFAQSGHVSVSNQSGHIYLVTNELGQYRLAILSRPTIDKAMFGVLATLQVGPGSQLVPLACPIALHRLDDEEEPALGLIRPDAPDYDGYASLLRAATAEDFARLYALEKSTNNCFNSPAENDTLSITIQIPYVCSEAPVEHIGIARALLSNPVYEARDVVQHGCSATKWAGDRQQHANMA